MKNSNLREDKQKLKAGIQQRKTQSGAQNTTSGAKEATMKHKQRESNTINYETELVYVDETEYWLFTEAVVQPFDHRNPAIEVYVLTRQWP
jgi:hypothetical protein